MEHHHLGTLSVTLRADPGDGLTAHQGRTFALAAWEAAGDELARRHPGRVFRLHRWHGAWRVTPAQIRRRDTHGVVRQIVELCDSLPLADPAHPPGAQAAGAAFADEAARVATWWTTSTTTRPPHWAWSDLDASPGPLAVLASMEGDHRLAVLQRVAAAGMLEHVVRSLTPNDRLRLVALAEGEPPGLPPPALSGTAPGRSTRATDRVPSSSQAPQPTTDDVDALVERVRARIATGHRVAPAHGEFTIRGDIDEPTQAGTTREAPATADESVRVPDGPADPATPPDPLERGDVIARSNWLGLTYLIRPMLRCGIGEALWMACLPEATVIARAWETLCGDDAAASLLTGAGTDRELPPLTPEHLSSISTHVLPRLAMTLGRLDRPHPTATLATSGPTTTLHLDGSPWPAIAWHDTPTATCVAEVVAAGFGEPKPSGLVPWLPHAGDPITAATLALVLGAPASVIAAMCQVATFDVDAFAGGWFRLEGRIIDDGETLVVDLPAHAIDLTLRRVGADADPGWVPWAQRTVHIRYRVDELG